MTIPNRLLLVRTQRQIKRTDLAEFLGVDYTTVYRWEKQHASMTLETLFKIARFFEVPPTAIMPNLAEVQLDTEETAHVS